MQPSPRSIVLIGFMGAGKTTVAKQLAKLTGFEVVSIDELIAARAGKSVADIFLAQGESKFREQETRAITALMPSKEQIIDTGGGAIVRNADQLRNLGYIIWLRGSADELWGRVANSSNRPMLETENTRATFSRLFADREPLYRATANHVIDVDGKLPSEIALEIVTAIS